MDWKTEKEVRIDFLAKTRYNNGNIAKTSISEVDS